MRCEALEERLNHPILGELFREYHELTDEFPPHHIRLYDENGQEYEHPLAFANHDDTMIWSVKCMIAEAKKAKAQKM